MQTTREKETSVIGVQEQQQQENVMMEVNYNLK